MNKSIFKTMIAFLFAQTANAAQSVAIQGRLLDSSGHPVTSSVSFTIKVKSPGAESCLLYQETQIVDLSQSQGSFALTLGAGTRAAASVDGGNPLNKVFSNTETISLTAATTPCANPSTSYTPAASDTRKIFITFNDGSGDDDVPAITMAWAPQAMYAQNSEKLSNISGSQFLRVASGTTPAELSSADYTALVDFLTNGVDLSGNFAQSGGATFSTGTGSVSLNGPVTVAANQGLAMSSGTGQFTQAYTGTTTSAAAITANNLTSGSIMSLSSNSTAAASGNKGLDVALSGANSSAAITRTGISSVVNASGTNSTNVAGYFSASGGTNNYGLIVENGSVGIGTTSPAAPLEVAGTIKATTTDTSSIFSNGVEALRVNTVANGVNYLTATPAAAGSGPILNTSGADGVVPLNIYTKGGGPILLAPGQAPALKLYLTASAVNYLQMQGAVTGSAPILSAGGTDANVDIKLLPRGSGKTVITGDQTTSGYLRVGSSTAPTNTTAGDLTTNRLNVGNVNFSGTGFVTMQGTVTDATGTVNAISLQPVFTPSAANTGQLRGMTVNAVWNGSNNITLGYASNYINDFRSSGSVSNALVAYNGTGLQLSGNSNNFGTITTVAGTLLQPVLSFSNTVTGTINNAVGVKVTDSSLTAGQTLNNQAGVWISGFAAATNNTGLLMGQSTIPTGNFGIYNASTNNNYFAGNVGIGTTGPTSLLHVNGAALATAWNTSSDIRLKENVKEIENPLDKILQLRGVEFDWRADVKAPTKHDQPHDIGVIAQEVEKVFPEAVTTPEKGYKSVAYSKLIAPVIEAVKALYARLTAVEADVAQLKARADKAEAENAALKADVEMLKARLIHLEQSIPTK
jgi:hypothetical protein